MVNGESSHLTLQFSCAYYRAVNFPFSSSLMSFAPDANIVTSICIFINFIISTTFSVETVAALRN
jgi:hypothetical protein